MKTVIILCLEMVLLATPLVRAEEETQPVSRFINATIDQSEKSLKGALESPSLGMQLTAAETVRQLKGLKPDRTFSSLVIPLMRIVKDENADASSRVVAAIALNNLNSARGDFAISRTAQFTNNERVKHVCSWLSYYQKLEEQRNTEREISAVHRSFPLPEPLPENLF
jgi:hypothetical protein